MGGTAGTGGTKGTPFQPTARQDGTSQIILHSITAMQPYQTKSFEELRFEDYGQGNKGTGGATQPGATGGFGTFGAPAAAPTGGLFGSAAPAAFGAPAPSPGAFGAFGSSPAPAPFGSPAPAPGAFGAPAPSGFGSSGTAFGAKPPGASGLFGAPSPAPGGSLFGSSAPAPSTSLFGSTAPAPFGAPAPASTGLFGAPTPAPAAPSSGFGSASSSLFGAPSLGAFGAPSPAPTSAFGKSCQYRFDRVFVPCFLILLIHFAGAPAPGGFGFGAAPTPSGFGAFGSSPAPPPSAFGAPSSGGFFGGTSTMSSFGAKPPGTPGLFGQPAASPGGSLFGQPQSAPSVFGASLAPPIVAVAPPVGAVIPPAANDVLASQLAALESKRKEMETKDSFRSQPSPSAAITAASLSERESSSFGPITPGRLSFPTRRSSPSSIAKIRPRGFASPTSDSSRGAMLQSLSKLGSTGKPMAGPESAAALPSTRLIVAPTPKPPLKLVLRNDEEKKEGTPNPFARGDNGASDVRVGEALGVARLSKPTGAFSSPEPVSTPINGPRATPIGSARSTNTHTQAQNQYDQSIDDEAGANSSNATSSASGHSNAAPTLTKEGYTCSPPISALQAMDQADLAAVENFSVERPGVGKVEWEGAVDVRHANLDKIVLIEPRSVSVYTEEEHMGVKPHIGTKLNRPALLTMEKVLPPEGSSPEAVEKFKQKVSRQTQKIGAELVEYDVTTGIWKIRVNHFSRYWFDSDADSDDDKDEETTQDLTPSKRKMDFHSGERGGRSPEKTMGSWKKRHEEKETEELVSEVDEASEKASEEFAQNAYHAMTSFLQRENAMLLQKEKEKNEQAVFPPEVPLVNDRDNVVKPKRYRPSEQDLRQAFEQKASITSFIIGDAKTKPTRSNFDFGMRFGRSFRVGWGADGSFLSVQKNGTIVRSKPKFGDGGLTAEQMRMLEAHQTNVHVHDKTKFSLLTIAPTITWDRAKNVLKSYAESFESASSTAKAAFAVLEAVRETQEAKSKSHSIDTLFDERCLFDFKRLMVSLCSDDVQRELASRGQPRDWKSLLAAISSGDLPFAAEMALEMRLYHLSGFLCSSSETRKLFVDDIKNLETIPRELKMFYRTVAGDVNMEIFRALGVDTFDWKRILAMQLTYISDANTSFAEKTHGSPSFPTFRNLAASNHPVGSTDLHLAMKQYELSVVEGRAPFPAPKYIGRTTNPTKECVLFKLLKLGGVHDGRSEDLSSTIDPLGYTSNSQDFSLAFHLSSVINTLPNQPRLTAEEEEILIDGFVAQLVSEGLWYWAVYVSMCSMESSPQSVVLWRFRIVKSLICQHFKPENIEQREFLEFHGVPKEMFEEALSFSFLTQGKIQLYLQHLSAAGKKEKTREELENILLPKSLFSNEEEMDAIVKMLNECQTVEKSLAGVLMSIVVAAKTMVSLVGMQEDQVKVVIPELLNELDITEATLLAYRSSTGRYSGTKNDLRHGVHPIPLGTFILRALNEVTEMRLQAMAVQEGISITSTTSKLLKVARDKFGPESVENFQRYLL